MLHDYPGEIGDRSLSCMHDLGEAWHVPDGQVLTITSSGVSLTACLPEVPGTPLEGECRGDDDNDADLVAETAAMLHFPYGL